MNGGLSLTAIRKDAVLCCGSRLRSGEVFAYVGSIQNPKDLKDRGNEQKNGEVKSGQTRAFVVQVVLCAYRGTSLITPPPPRTLP